MTSDNIRYMPLDLLKIIIDHEDFDETDYYSNENLLAMIGNLIDEIQDQRKEIDRLQERLLQD